MALGAGSTGGARRVRAVAGAGRGAVARRHPTKDRRRVWQVARGRDGPSPRGWFSPVFNHREPATQTDLEQHFRGPALNVWVFRPAPESESAPPLRVETLGSGRVRIWRGQTALELQVEEPGRFVIHETTAPSDWK